MESYKRCFWQTWNLSCNQKAISWDLFHTFRTLDSGVQSYLNQLCAPEGLTLSLDDRKCITKTLNDNRRDCLQSPVSGTSILRSHRFQGSWINPRGQVPTEQPHVVPTLPLHLPDSLPPSEADQKEQQLGPHLLSCIPTGAAGRSKNKPPPSLVSCPRFCSRQTFAHFKPRITLYQPAPWKSADQWVSIFLLKQPRKVLSLWIVPLSHGSEKPLYVILSDFIKTFSF